MRLVLHLVPPLLRIGTGCNTSPLPSAASECRLLTAVTCGLLCA